MYLAEQISEIFAVQLLGMSPKERRAPGTNFQVESTRLISAPGTGMFYLLRFAV